MIKALPGTSGKRTGNNLSSTNVERITGAFRIYGFLVILSIIWGMAFVAIRYLEPFLSPVNMTILRWFLASGAFLILAPFLGRPKQKFQREDIPRFLMVAFANVVAYHLTLNASENAISAGLAVLIVAVGPVFILILSWAFLGERHGATIFMAVALAFVGSLILAVGSDITNGHSTVTGILEAFGTAVSYSVFAVFSKPLVQKYGARPFTIWAGLVGTLMLLPLLSGSFMVQVQALPLYGWLAMLYLSILSTVAGYMLFYTLVNRGAVSRLSVQLYLIPVVGVAGGALLLGEQITVFTLAGGAFMLLAVAISTRRKQLKKS